MPMDPNAQECRLHTVTDREAGLRLDKMLADAFPDLSRSRLQDLIRDGQVSVCGKPVTKPRHPMMAGDRIEIVTLVGGG